MGIVLTQTEDHASIAEVPSKTIRELAGIKLMGKGAGDIVKTNNENIIKILQ